MTSRSSKAPAFLAGLLLAVCLWGCRENTILGSDLIPAGDSIQTVRVPDTFTVLARSIYDDSVVTSYTKVQTSTGQQLGTTFQPAGSVTNDPFFGRTQATLYFQPSPNLTGVVAPGVVDSVVLVLPYSGITWGDTTAAPSLRFRVFQLADTLIRDTFYYSSQRATVNRSALFGQKDFYFRDFTDSVFVDGANRAPHLRMQLDTTQLMPLVRTALAAGTGTQADFLRVFKGLCIEPDTNKVSSLLPYFLFAGGADIYTRPGFVIYYRDATGTATNIPIYFQSSFGNAYSFIQRNYSGTPAAPYLAGTTDPNILLLQNEPGAAIDFRMPYVKNLPRAVYNKAELVLTRIDTAGSAQFFAPQRIFPYKVMDGAVSNIADRLPVTTTEPIDFIDGRARTVTIGSITVTQYVLNFPRELQQAVSAGRDELHLRINGLTSLPGAYRLIVGGRNHPQWGLKLNVAYSKQ